MKTDQHPKQITEATALKEMTSGFSKITETLKNRNIKLKDINDIQFEYDCLVAKIKKLR